MGIHLFRNGMPTRSIMSAKKNKPKPKTKNQMTIEGTVHHIGPVETIGDKGFTKRLLVVNNGQQYDNLTPIEFAKDKTGLCDSLRVGQTVSVHVNIGGREYNGKYYSSIRGWKIDAGQAAPQPQAVAATVEDETLPF